LWKVAKAVKVPPGATVTDSSGFSVHVVLSAETPPSSPSPPDICSETYEASTQSPGHVRVRLPDEMFVYVR